MIKLCLFFAFVYAVSPALVPRTATVTWLDLATTDRFRGVRLRKIPDGYEITWMEDFDEVTNPLGVHFNYIFEESGNREIIDVPNLCGRYVSGTLPFEIQKYILTEYANTASCPIKKGTKVSYTVPKPYTYMTENRECGVVDGSGYVFKVRPRGRRSAPMLLRIHFRGNSTGPECSTID